MKQECVYMGGVQKQFLYQMSGYEERFGFYKYGHIVICHFSNVLNITSYTIPQGFRPSSDYMDGARVFAWTYNGSGQSGVAAMHTFYSNGTITKDGGQSVSNGMAMWTTDD